MTSANGPSPICHPWAWSGAQRRGIGSALLGEVVARAAARGEPAVVLEGDPAFYGRFGYGALGAAWNPHHAARLGTPGVRQAIQLHEVAPPLRGQVVYPPAFEAVGDAA